jgi:DNA-binding CsgD family transcriptional regulator
LPPLREALAISAELGAELLAGRVRAELLAAGARPRRTALIGPAALTPAERRVAALVMDGRSNPGVAAELSISLKTVETHLRNVYRKLGISHRAQLAGVLAPAEPAHQISG